MKIAHAIYGKPREAFKTPALHIECGEKANIEHNERWNLHFNTHYKTKIPTMICEITTISLVLETIAQDYTNVTGQQVWMSRLSILATQDRL